MKKIFQALLLMFNLILVCGCGNRDTVIPTDKLTEEQLEEVRKEDDALEEEEGGGGF